MLRLCVRTALVLVLLVVGAYLLRGPLFGGLIAEAAADALAEQLGGRYSIASVEGNWISELVLVGLRTEEAPPTGALTRLQFERAAVSYDLRVLLGDEPLAGLRSLKIFGTRVDLDLTRPPGPPSAEQGRSVADVLDALPRRLPHLDLRGAVHLHGENGEFAVEGLSVRGAGAAFDVAATEVVLPASFGAERRGALAGRLVCEADDTFVWSSATQVAGVGLPRVRLARGGRLEATVGLGASTVEVRWEGGEGTLHADAIDVPRLPAWILGLLPERLALPDEGHLTVDLRIGSLAPLALRGQVRLARARWQDVRVDQAVLLGAYAGDQARITSAYVQSRDLRLDAVDVRLEPARPYLVAAAQRIDLHVPDLRPWLPELDRPVAVELRARSERERELIVEELRLEAQGVRCTGRGRAELPADPARWRDTTVRGDFTGLVEDFRRRDYSVAGRIHLAGRVTGALRDLDAAASVEGRDLRVEGRQVRRLQMNAQVRWPDLKLQDLRLESDAGTVLAQGEIDLARRRLRAGSYAVDIPDLASFAKLFPRAPAAAGSVAGEGTVSRDEAGLHGEVSLHVRALAVGGWALGDLELGAKARRDLIEVEKLQIAGRWGKGGGRGVARLDKRWARVDAFAFERGRIEGALAAPALISWTDDAVELNGLYLETLGGRITGSVRRADRWEIALQGHEIALERLHERLTGRAAFRLLAKDDTFDVEITAPDLAFEGYAGEILVKAHQTDAGLHVEHLRLQIGQALDVTGRADLPWRLTRDGVTRVADVEPRLALDALVRDVSRFARYADAASASISVHGDPSGLRATARVRDLRPDAKLVLQGDTWVELEIAPDHVQASVVAEKNRFGDVAGTARSDRGLDWTRPAEVERWLEEANVEGRLELTVPDLKVLQRFTPDVLVRLEGECDVSLRFKGPVRAPKLEGFAEVADLACKLSGDGVPSITAGRGKVVLAGDTLEVQDLRFELGYAETALAGTVRLRTEGAPLLDLKLVGENVLLVRDRYLRLRADVDLALLGDLDTPLLTGTARITDALYSRPISPLASDPPDVEDEFQLFSFREGPLARMAYDVRITADRTVRVRSNVIRGDFSCDLLLRGTGQVPEPNGRVFFRETLVELPLSSLKVDTGELRFPAENPFAPRVDVQAHTRMRGYDLSVHLMGQLPTVDVHISSRPSLSHEDAVLLLTTGSTREEYEQDFEGNAINKVGVLLGERLISEVGGPPDPDAPSILDRFSFEVGRDVSRDGEETIEGEFEISRRVYLRAERDRFEDFNGGLVWRIRFK
ncbi:MAG: translocation/assembly module TamB domain-containing protein [Planctomycetota bacterium]